MQQRQQNSEPPPGVAAAPPARASQAPWLSALIAGARHIADNTALLPSLIRKPRLVRLWLTSARRAQFSLGLALLVLVFMAPPMLGAISSKLYPPIYERQNVFERLIEGRRTEANPLRETRYGQFLAGIWILGLSPFLVLLLQHVSVAVGLGREEARRLIAAAERLSRTDPEHSARLYRTAQGLMLDADRPRPDTGNKTQVISRSRGHTQAPSHVGPDERYRIDTALGSGGMGVVYAGTDTRLERPVALKQLFDHLVTDTDHLERFRQEALALASLAHPHIVTIYDLIEHDGHFWIVMELLDGGSLAEQIKRQSHLPVGRCIDIACAVAEGLDCAHAHGIVHRDIKPLNILFMSDGQPKLTDFGNAKLNESIVHTREGLMMGSPSFMSPEQVDGSPIDLRTDIYSLGITLYQMLTGKVPFEGELNSVLAQHVNKPPRPPSELVSTVPAEIDDVVLKMLAKAPEDRFQDCKAAIAALRAAAG